MSIPAKSFVLMLAGLASPAAEAQFMGLGFESNITLTQQDLDLIRQTVDQQIHGKPVGATPGVTPTARTPAQSSS